MACDTYRRTPEQTLAERKAEVKQSIDRLQKALAEKRVKAVVGPQGAVTFAGWTDKAGVTDACALRSILTSGSQLARTEIMRASALAGKPVNKFAAVHSHDGGATWHPNHGR